MAACFQIHLALLVANDALLALTNNLRLIHGSIALRHGRRHDLVGGHFR